MIEKVPEHNIYLIVDSLTNYSHNTLLHDFEIQS
jgi:hypothetical protein